MVNNNIVMVVNINISRFLYQTNICAIFFHLFNNLNTASLAMYRGCGNQCDSDKKPLERHGKASERVHRWLPIEFIDEK